MQFGGLDRFLQHGRMRKCGNDAVRPVTGDECKGNFPIGEDVGALVTFFDLLVLHEKVPAFDYSATFDPLSAKNQ